MRENWNCGNLTTFRLATGLMLFLALVSQGVYAASDTMKDDGIKKVAANGVKKIVLPLFQVIFRTRMADTANSRQNFFGSSPKASATMSVDWPNADKVMLQNVAEKAYTEFVQKLTASGMEVVPMATVTGTEAYKKLQGSTVPVIKDDYIIMTPKGMTIYDPLEKLDPNGGFTMGIFNTNMKGEGDVVKELNADLAGMGVVRVSLIVSIGGYKKEGSISISGDQASASISFDPMVNLFPSVPNGKLGGAFVTDATILSNLSLVEGYKMSGVLAKDTSRAWIESSLNSSVVAGTLKDSMTSGEKVGMVAVKILGALSGQSASLDKYEFTVNAENYEKGTLEAVGSFGEMLADRIKAAK